LNEKPAFHRELKALHHPGIDYCNAAHLRLRGDWDNGGSFTDDPSALATFDIYLGNPEQIFIQQTYQ